MSLRVGESDEGGKFIFCQAARDGVGGQLRAIAEISGDSGDDESGGGVDYGDIAMRAGLIVEHVADEGGIFRGGAAAQTFGGSEGHVKIAGSNGEAADGLAVGVGPDFGDESFAAEGDFVEAIGAVNDEGALNA